MASAAPERGAFVKALRVRPFALLWGGQAISAIGDGAFLTALSWQVLVLTGSATALGIVLVAQSIPRVTFLLFGGIVADRLPCRVVLLWSDSARAVFVLAIAALGWLHVLRLWHLVALGLGFGLAEAFFIPAYQAIPPQIVPGEALTSANALTGASRSLSLLIGPALGAALVAIQGPSSAFAFDGATFVISALFLIAMRPPPGEPAQSGVATRESVLGGIRAGLGYVLRSPWLWVTIAMASLGNIAWAPLQVSLPRLVHDVYGQGVWLLGFILSASAAGALIATVVIGHLPRLPRRGLIAYSALIASSLAFLALGLPLPRAAAPAIAIAAAVVFGVGTGIFDVIWVTVMQELVPSNMLGRVSSIDWLGSFCVTPVGFALVGMLTDRMGASWVFVAGGLSACLLLAIGLSVRDVRQMA